MLNNGTQKCTIPLTGSAAGGQLGEPAQAAHRHLAPPQERRGTYIETSYTSREMTLYGVYESELKTITHLDASEKFWSGVASAGVTLLLACFWDISISTSSSTFPPMGYAFMILTAVVTVCGMWKSIQSKRERKNEWNRIMSESKIHDGRVRKNL